MNCQDFMLGGKSLGNDGDDFDLDQPIGADERWHPDQRARGRMRHTEITTANFTDRRHIFGLEADYIKIGLQRRVAPAAASACLIFSNVCTVWARKSPLPTTSPRSLTLA